MRHWNSTIDINGSQVFRIRGGNLEVAGTFDPAKVGNYEARVDRLLNLIHSRATGHILLDEIRLSLQFGRSLVIVPFTRGRDAIRGSGAAAVGMDEGLAALYGVPVQGGRARSGGSDVQLLFDLQNFSPHLSPTAGFQADEALFHELVHAKRQTQGREHRLPVGHYYDHQEEFIAIMVSNIYASEGGATWLRDSHLIRPHPLQPDTIIDVPNPFREMDGQRPQPTAAQNFAQRYAGEINQFCSSDANFARRLGLLEARFNPVREHLINIGALRRHPRG